MAPATFGKYVATELLGSGGMAEVYAGIHPELERKVAIKVILPQFATESNFEERFRREARLVASLRHAHIVQLYDYDVVDGRHFMVMEYLEGGTLKDYLRTLRRESARMPLSEIANLLEAVGAALDYAHGRGAIHRDIKPANILFTPEREPVLTDFGIAKLLEDSVHLTATGGVVGSPFYMPPEQATGGEVDAHSDQYALGVVLYELVTGQLPFQGGSAVAVMTQHLNNTPPSPRTLNAALPAGVEAVLLKALAKRPDARFGSCGELAKAFQDAVAGHSDAARPAPTVDANARTALGDPSVAPANLGEPTAAIPVGGAATVVDTSTPSHAPIQDAPTVVSNQADTAPPLSQPPRAAPPVEPPPAHSSADASPSSQPAPLERASPDAALPAVDKGRSTDAALPAVDKGRSTDTPSQTPALVPPKPTTQNFHVGGIQAGIVNQGGEQTFSGDLTFNLNFGDVSNAPPQTETRAKAKGNSDTPELDAIFESLRRAFAGSVRVERFVKLVTQFYGQLEALPAERAPERQQVAKRAQALLLEMTAAKPDPDLVEIMGTSLVRAVQPLAGVDPELPTLVTRITSWSELLVQPE